MKKGKKKEEEEEEDEEDEEEEESPSSAEKGYVAISLYYLDGPLNNVQLRAQVHVVNENEGKHLRDVEECHPHLEDNKKNTLQSEEPFTIKRSCSDCELDREDEEDIPFECDEENKAEVHDTLANMYFNKVVLPEMDYVEDFVDFLIDAELNDLPVLKRACERYLCGELNTKKELMTSLILDLFFIAMVFRLPVMKSMTLTELCDRYHEMEDIGLLLEREEYRSLDKRIRQLCGDRNLADLIDECKRFREQCLRVQRVNFSIKNKVNN
ncbi:hypothetical protein Mgra_00003475 [Meloidogyne graminicola]|uniref:Uncharacterized protein n=1 Tax=Meloidogyne graminicola TaxID=189291 RepID=A0A8S9ZUX5_9BILA|nr:hypothetical protein Mgra_00003475 [Meloidogyne graminicola]